MKGKVTASNFYQGKEIPFVAVVASARQIESINQPSNDEIFSMYVCGLLCIVRLMEQCSSTTRSPSAECSATAESSQKIEAIKNLRLNRIE